MQQNNQQRRMGGVERCLVSRQERRLDGKKIVHGLVGVQETRVCSEKTDDKGQGNQYRRREFLPSAAQRRLCGSGRLRWGRHFVRNPIVIGGHWLVVSGWISR